ncbi:hypothetical protein WA026_013331 [Henosepilachna vigintioctopunctata]|uniref:Tudor domain-containing protein n=1 Tax=Henosepilachna vigintioctopunctata TaxID=420089 RepID=A0AAW1VCT3_9CUCU
MDETKRLLGIIMKVVRRPIIVRELIEICTTVIGIFFPQMEHRYLVLTEYLMTHIPHILRLEGSDVVDLDTLVSSNEPREINTTGMYGFPSSETNPDMNRQTRLTEEADNQDEQGFITIESKEKGKSRIVESSDTAEEKQMENYKSDPNFIEFNQGDSGDYYRNDSSIVEKENLRLPSDIVHLDHKIRRDSVSGIMGKAIRVVVDQVYDPSKFWLHIDNGRLYALTEAMNSFYENERDKYLIPETHMDIGRYCVAFTLNLYSRCIIVKKEPNASYVNVFYIDYGTLGKIPKDQVWFLTEPFSRLPAQAIRARLANIYPPTEDTLWSLEATYRFYKLVNSQPFGALVVNNLNGVVEVCLVSLSNEYINSILVEEGHALFTYQAQKKTICDTHCSPKYKHIHLFPDFEEIEQWLVPSVEEIEEFCGTSLTAEFFLLHCFWRSVDSDDDIQEKMKKLMRRQQKSVQYIQPSELLKMENKDEILEFSYGNLFQDYEDFLIQNMENSESDLSSDESDSEYTLTDSDFE